MASGSSTPAANPEYAARLSLRLRLVLVAVAAACVVAFGYANVHTESFRLAFPRFEPWLWNLYLTTFLAGLVGACAMVWRRRYGFWTLVVAGILASTIGVYAMGLTLIGVAIVLAIGAVWFAVQPEWAAFV